METPHDHEDVEPGELASDEEPGFGEQEEAAQEQEWAEDAAEGGEADI